MAGTHATRLHRAAVDTGVLDSDLLHMGLMGGGRLGGRHGDGCSDDDSGAEDGRGGREGGRELGAEQRSTTSSGMRCGGPMQHSPSGSRLAGWGGAAAVAGRAGAGREVARTMTCPNLALRQGPTGIGGAGAADPHRLLPSSQRLGASSISRRPSYGQVTGPAARMDAPPLSASRRSSTQQLLSVGLLPPPPALPPQLHAAVDDVAVGGGLLPPPPIGRRRSRASSVPEGLLLGGLLADGVVYGGGGGTAAAPPTSYGVLASERPGARPLPAGGRAGPSASAASGRSSGQGTASLVSRLPSAGDGLGRPSGLPFTAAGSRRSSIGAAGATGSRGTSRATSRAASRAASRLASTDGGGSVYDDSVVEKPYAAVSASEVEDLLAMLSSPSPRPGGSAGGGATAASGARDGAASGRSFTAGETEAARGGQVWRPAAERG